MTWNMMSGQVQHASHNSLPIADQYLVESISCVPPFSNTTFGFAGVATFLFDSTLTLTISLLIKCCW